jgi:hypothetical protein
MQQKTIGTQELGLIDLEERLLISCGVELSK